jgi:hypothetical protein
MKKILFSLLFGATFIVAGVTFVSCDDTSNPLKTNISYKPADMPFVLDSLNFLAAVKTEHLLFTQNINADIDSILEAHNVSNLATLSEAEVDTISIRIVSPTGVTLNWISSARVSIQIPGQQELTIAHTAAINSAGQIITFVIDNVSVLPYLNNNSFTVRVYGNITPPLPVAQINMLLHLGFNLQVQVL